MNQPDDKLHNPDAIQDRRKQIEAMLAAQGYRMDVDAGAISGEGHLLLTDDGEDVVDVDTVPPSVSDLAQEWSDLTDRLMDLDPDSLAPRGAKP